MSAPGLRSRPMFPRSSSCCPDATSATISRSAAIVNLIGRGRTTTLTNVQTCRADRRQFPIDARLPPHRESRQVILTPASASNPSVSARLPPHRESRQVILTAICRLRTSPHGGCRTCAECIEVVGHAEEQAGLIDVRPRRAASRTPDGRAAPNGLGLGVEQADGPDEALEPVRAQRQHGGGRAGGGEEPRHRPVHPHVGRLGGERRYGPAAREARRRHPDVEGMWNLGCTARAPT